MKHRRESPESLIIHAEMTNGQGPWLEGKTLQEPKVLCCVDISPMRLMVQLRDDISNVMSDVI